MGYAGEAVDSGCFERAVDKKGVVVAHKCWRGVRKCVHVCEKLREFTK